jgi:plasmid rolling circle replication initiator protein Rep
MKWQAKAFQAIPKVLEDHPKSRFIFLTLTVRNCHLLELRDTLRQMHRAWTKLVKRKEFSLVQGWMRNVEITRGADDTAHPHYHALLMVKPSYFSTGYVSQARWTELWQSCLGVDYTPIVDVRSVRARKGSQCFDMTSAILETVKYSVKPSDVTQNEPVSSRTMPDYEWLSVLTDQIHKTRGIATGGVLRKYLRDLECEPDDLVHIEEDGLSDSSPDAPRVMFDWDDRPQRYRMQSEECGRV